MGLGKSSGLQIPEFPATRSLAGSFWEFVSQDKELSEALGIQGEGNRDVPWFSYCTHCGDVFSHAFAPATALLGQAIKIIPFSFLFASFANVREKL